MDRAADEALGNAIARQYLALPFRRSAAVAAHGREDERFGAERLQLGNHLLGAIADIGDAAAAAAHGDRHARLDLRPHLGTLELLGDGVRYVVHLDRLELLADVDHARQRNVEAARDVDFDAITDHFLHPPCVEAINFTPKTNLRGSTG